jgi:hypothetical protein
MSNVEEHFGVLGERWRGLEVLELWEIFVRDLHANLAIVEFWTFQAFSVSAT